MPLCYQPAIDIEQHRVNAVICTNDVMPNVPLQIAGNEIFTYSHPFNRPRENPIRIVPKIPGTTLAVGEITAGHVAAPIEHDLAASTGIDRPALPRLGASHV